MGSIVLKWMPRPWPSWEQSKAFVWDGSLSVAFMLSACRETLYSLTKVIRESFASKGTTDGILSIVLPCATGGWVGNGMEDGMVKLAEVLAC